MRYLRIRAAAKVQSIVIFKYAERIESQSVQAEDWQKLLFGSALGYIGSMENQMETTIMGYIRV